MEVQSRKKRAIRYSFAMMLFLIACLCGFLGGYQLGYKSGDNSWHYGKTYVTVYNVADLVTPPKETGRVDNTAEDFDSLIAFVDDARADQPQGACRIQPFPTNKSLVVSGNGVVHRRVSTLLKELREASPRGQTEEVEVRAPL